MTSPNPGGQRGPAEDVKVSGAVCRYPFGNASYTGVCGLATQCIGMHDAGVHALANASVCVPRHVCDAGFEGPGMDASGAERPVCYFTEPSGNSYMGADKGYECLCGAKCKTPNCGVWKKGAVTCGCKGGCACSTYHTEFMLAHIVLTGWTPKGKQDCRIADPIGVTGLKGASVYTMTGFCALQ